MSLAEKCQEYLSRVDADLLSPDALAVLAGLAEFDARISSVRQRCAVAAGMA